MVHLESIGTPLSWVLLLLGVAICVLSRYQVRKSLKPSPQPVPVSPNRKAEPAYSEDAYYAIEPLHNFDVDAEEPLKIRPFKPKFHMTMGIENITPSDLIAMDKTYRSRLLLRATLLHRKRHEILACNPKAAPAVLELYTWLTLTYLPTRFPNIFTPSPPDSLLNNITATHLPLHPSSASHALSTLCTHIDTEFLFLLPSTSPSDGGKYRLEAFITCSPNGFNTRSKLNLSLANIHAPVPGYALKIEKSMDRFFATLPVGKVVRRWNWGVSTSGEYFCLRGNHMSEEEMVAKGDGKGVEEEEEVDLSTTVLRCERQTVHRLPESGAVVFAFKTYQYPIKELRDEGSGEALAEAIDGLGSGSVPGMTVYKRQVVWGGKVKAFLRGEIES